MKTRKHPHRTALRDLTRQHIRDAVVRVTTRVGVHGLTMDGVAEEAGIAKGTLYRYFDTKEALIRDTIDASLAPIRDELLALARDDAPPADRLRRMTLRHLAFFETHRDFFRVLLHERSRAQLRAARRRSGVYNAVVDAAQHVLRDGVSSGVFRPLDDGKLGTMIIDANIAVISRRLLSDETTPVEEDADFLTDVLMHGIASGEKR